MVRRSSRAVALLAVLVLTLQSSVTFLVPKRAHAPVQRLARPVQSALIRNAEPYPLEKFGPLRLRRGKVEEAMGLARVIPAYIKSFSTASVVLILMFLSYPIVKARDPIKRELMDRWNALWARVTALLYFRVRVVNPEHLPAKDSKESYVYISNHQSFMDILAMYFLGRSFKWVSKASIKKIPIIGWAMSLTGHVFLQRDDRRSQITTIRECIDKLKKGASMFFFPEGTRSKTGRLGEFKKGAFSIARKAKVGMVPVTVMGTGDLMPPGREFRLFRIPGVNLVVHPIITAEEVQQLSDVELIAKAEGLIRSGLPASLQQAE